MATVLAMPKSDPVATSDASWLEANWLPCRLSVEMPILRFTMGDLLRLEVNTLVDTHVANSADVPLRVNDALIGWAQFEVAGDRLGVRLTELA